MGISTFAVFLYNFLVYNDYWIDCRIAGFDHQCSDSELHKCMYLCVGICIYSVEGETAVCGSLMNFFHLG